MCMWVFVVMAQAVKQDLVDLEMMWLCVGDISRRNISTHNLI